MAVRQEGKQSRQSSNIRNVTATATATAVAHVSQQLLVQKLSFYIFLFYILFYFICFSFISPSSLTLTTTN